MQAIFSVNTESVNLKPGAIINTLFKQQELPSDEEQKDEEPVNPAIKK